MFTDYVHVSGKTPSLVIKWRNHLGVISTDFYSLSLLFLVTLYHVSEIVVALE